jgi:hypothetical protein
VALTPVLMMLIGLLAGIVLVVAVVLLVVNKRRG